jgi:hypothetical protein
MHRRRYQGRIKLGTVPNYCSLCHRRLSVAISVFVIASEALQSHKKISFFPLTFSAKDKYINVDEE